MQKLNNGYRLDYVDMAKGLAIIGVFFGHHLVLSDYMTKWFWSWHIPVFFFVTGLCSKSLFVNNMKKSFNDSIKNIFLPYAVTMISLSICIVIITHGSFFDLLYRLFDDMIYKETPLWFMMALFWGRLIISCFARYNIEKQLLIYIILFLIGWEIGPYLNDKNIQIPLSLLKGLMAPVFIISGKIIREIKDTFILNGCPPENKQKKGTYLFICVISIVIFGNLASINYFYYDFPLGLINIVTSCSLCVAVLYICNVIFCIDYIILTPVKKLLTYIGKYSLYILCAHTMELQLQISRFFPNCNYIFTCIFILILVSILFLKRVPLVNTIYKLKE